LAKLRPMTEELHIGEVDDDELSAVLMSVLPRGAQFRADEVEYRTMADEWALTLQYREGKIVRAVAGPAMTSELEEQVRTAIERVLLAPPVPGSAAGRSLARGPSKAIGAIETNFRSSRPRPKPHGLRS
jgi:hypothetical protein